MPFALMYDSDNETYPAGAQYIAAYVDGSRTGRNYARARAARPDARFLLISAVGEADADVIDIEPGNVWPPEAAVPWIRRQLDRGATPAYYCNTATREQCVEVFRAAGLPELPWWRADYRASEHRRYGYPPAELPLGEIGWQFADPPLEGSHWDVSIISPQLRAYLDGQGPAPAASTASAGAANATAASAGAAPLGGGSAASAGSPGADPGFGAWDGVTFNLAAGHFYGLITGSAASHGGAFERERPPILAIQHRLQQLGYAPTRDGWADGIFGRPTADAVAAWQARNRPGPLTTRPGEIWGDDWAALFAATSIPATAPADPPRPAPPAMSSDSFAAALGAPDWPVGFGLGDYLGDRAGPAQSHGGDRAVDGPDVIACIVWVQRRMQALRWTAVEDPDWADGAFEAPTVAAVAAWQRERLSRVPGFAMAADGFGRVYRDDYAALQGGDNRINS